MRNILLTLVLGVCSGHSLLSQSTVSKNALAHGSPSRLIVQVAPGKGRTAVQRALAMQGGLLEESLPQIQLHALRIPESALLRAKAGLERSGLFTFVERDGVAEMASVPNDPNFATQWHLNRIEAPMAWSISTGSSSVPIAIVDSGVYSSHPDLSAKVGPGWNFLSGNSNTADVQGHGTATAGAAAAATNNAIGVAGVAWSNKIMPIVVLDATGYASYFNMAQAIVYAADRGVRVINISLGGATASSALQSAVNYAWNKGAVVIAAAMNNGTSKPYYPAACNNVVAVAATDAYDQRAGFSNFGAWVDLAAPGVSILSTNRGGGYGYHSGTSFSAPVTAGIAALMLSVNPSLSASQLVSLLEQTSDDLGAPGFDAYFGWGRVNAAQAVAAAASQRGALASQSGATRFEAGSAALATPAIADAPDAQPPAISIDAPEPNAQVRGAVTIQVSASDDVGVALVAIYIDEIQVYTGTAAPYSFDWRSRKTADGPHVITATAWDGAGNAATAKPVTVYR